MQVSPTVVIACSSSVVRVSPSIKRSIISLFLPGLILPHLRQRIPVSGDITCLYLTPNIQIVNNLISSMVEIWAEVSQPHYQQPYWVAEIMVSAGSKVLSRPVARGADPRHFAVFPSHWDAINFIIKQDPPDGCFYEKIMTSQGDSS